MGKIWMITGVSDGFGYEMTRQLLEKGRYHYRNRAEYERVRGFLNMLDKSKGLAPRRAGENGGAYH